MKKWVLSRRDSMETIQKVEASLGISLNLPKSAQVSCAEPEDGVVFASLDGFEFIQAGDAFIPFLGSSGTLALFPSAMVDEGAIKFLLNGADVMRPGIRKFDDWGPSGKLVVVREEKKGRPLAVGPATVSGSEAAAMTKGGCVKNSHHLGDRFWNAHKAI